LGSVDNNIKELLTLDRDNQPNRKLELFPEDLQKRIKSLKNSGKGRNWWVVGGTAVAAGVAAAFLLSGGGPKQLPGPPGPPGGN